MKVTKGMTSSSRFAKMKMLKSIGFLIAAPSQIAHKAADDVITSPNTMSTLLNTTRMMDRCAAKWPLPP